MKRKRAATLKETKVKSHDYRPAADIPHEVLLQILQKLPVKTLMKFTCVCKLWLGSIVNDPRFIEAHLLESKKKPILVFNFLPKALDKFENPSLCQTNHMYYLEKDDLLMGKEKVIPYLHKLLPVKENNYRKTIIGDCNGLVCFLVGGHPFIIYRRFCRYFVIEIFNFSKLEKLRVVSRIHTPGKMMHIENCQFGYDCLSSKYKLVCILCHGYHANSRQCFILTLGSSDTQLWREIEVKNLAIPPDYSTQFICSINGALYWWVCENFRYKRALLSFDLHEEKFQVIDLPKELINPYPAPQQKDLPLEHRKCLCVASIKESDTHSGVVELHILQDRIKQVWAKEIIIFDLPVAICPSKDNNGSTTFSLSGDGTSITSTRIIEFTGKLFLYWGEALLQKGKKSRIIHFYDLQSRELNQVRVGSKCGSQYHHVSNHVENLISLRAWATKGGDEGGELGRNMDKDTVLKIEDMFKQMPPSLNAAFSFFSSLGRNNNELV
ncbi:hypothetical protein MKX03_011198 [Papaver bracteatum]|nr:hypothetical protein MKX03_011198 [Papaver bracteatum]